MNTSNITSTDTSGLFGTSNIYPILAPAAPKIPPAIAPSCGVKQDLYVPYVLQDHQWNSPITRNALYGGQSFASFFDALLILAERIVKVDNLYWMKTGLGDIWLPKPNKTDAIRDAINLWQHEVIGGYIIDRQLLEVFFEGVLKVTDVEDNKSVERNYHIGSCPQFSDIIMIPFGPTFVGYKNKKYLNVWIDRRMPSGVSMSDRLRGKILLRLIYRSLCAGKELSPVNTLEMDMLENMVLTDNYTIGEGETLNINTDFRFIMHWLAALYQKPGVNLLTNLWLCGDLQGVGKGTLVQVMRLLIGTNLCCLLKQSEIERGWSDHLMGKVLIEVDELDTSGKGSWSSQKWENWIKEMTIKDEANFAERNVGNHEVINIGNYIFTMNDEAPIYLDKSDRRNYFVKTTDNAEWVRFAAEVQEQILKVEPAGLAGGFGWFLERIQIDWRFINKGHTNTFKQSIQSSSMSNIEEWVVYDEGMTRDNWIKSSDFHTEYLKWHHRYTPGVEAAGPEKFGRQMKALARKNQLGVEAKMDRGGCSNYRVGAVVKAAVIDGEAIAQSMNQILNSVWEANTTQETVNENKSLAIDYDVKVNEVVADFSGLTQMQKMRAKLRAMDDES